MANSFVVYGLVKWSLDLFINTDVVVYIPRGSPPRGANIIFVSVHIFTGVQTATRHRSLKKMYKLQYYLKATGDGCSLKYEQHYRSSI